MDLIKAEEGLTIDQRVDVINKTTENIKRGFFTIACEMQAIKDDMNTDQKTFLAYIEEQTGYKKSQVFKFLRAKIALENLCPRGHKIPDSEYVIRPLAVGYLNDQPELQAEIWNKACEEAGEEGPSAAQVKKVRDAHFEKAETERYEKLREQGTVARKTEIERALTDEEAAMLKSFLRKMAMEYHPDRGGDHEKMEICNTLRMKLTKLI